MSNKKNLFSVKGKTVLITGGGSGIGNALSIGFKRAGAKVVVFEKKTLKKNKGIKYFNVDLSQHELLKKNFQIFLKEFKKIDVLINNAGITIPLPTSTYSLKNWNDTIKVNLTAVFLMCKLSGFQMIKRKQGGSIINITSIGGSLGFANNAAYGSSKGAVRNLTKSLAEEWGKHAIRVNNLVPGYTHTPMNKKSWKNKKLKKQRSDRTMLKRWAEPSEMLGPAIFLASDASKYVTACDLYVDGGWVAKGI